MKTTVSRNPVAFSLCLICGIVTLIGGLRPAYAAEYRWGANAGGDYHDWMNWIPFGVPGDLDTAVFGQPYSIPIAIENPVTTTKRLRVEQGTVTFLMGVPSGNCATPATYNLLGSGTFIRTAATIGALPGVSATLRVRDSMTSCSPDSYVNAEGMLVLGQVTDSVGTLLIGDGSDQTTIWNSAYPTMIGSAGHGVLQIQEADELINSTALMGSTAGSSGTADIWGTWTNNGILTIGNSGTGTMSVYHTVTNSGDAYIAKEPWSSGTVHIEPDWGMSPTPDGWLCEGSLYVGGSDQLPGGTGSITISNSGKVEVNQSTTVWDSGSITIEEGFFFGDDVAIRGGGIVTVDGTSNGMGSIFESTILEVWANGTLEVLGPGSFANAAAMHSQGTVTINGGHLFVDHIFSATADSTVLLAHGMINVGSLDGFLGDFQFGSGFLGISRDGLTIDDGQPLGNDLSLSTSRTLSVRDELAVGPVSSGSIYLTVDATISSGTGIVGSLSGDATLATVTLAGGDTSWTMDGDLQVRGVNDAELMLFAGARVSNGDAFLATHTGTLAEVALTGWNTDWDCSGSLYAGGDAAAAGGTGTLDVDNNAELTVDGTMKVWDDFLVEIDGGNVVTTDLDIIGEVIVLGSGILDVRGGTLDIYGGGTLDGAIVGDGTTAVALQNANSNWSMPGSLLLGTAVQGSGRVKSLVLKTDTTVTVEENVTVLNNTGLKLYGGTINANAIDLLSTDFSGFGALNGDVSTTGTMTANGDLVVGDIGSDIGVQMGSTLDVGPHHVTLNKQGLLFAADFTSIAGGTLTVPHGLRITPSNHVSGFGIIDTPDDPATPLINDGFIIGSSASERIELTGYVKGLGSLENVTISGTDDPGFTAPSAVNRRSVDYRGRLVVQIGGLIAGSEHDQVNHSATAGLGGELIVELIDGFEPGPGDRFTILRYGSRTGQFDTLSLPILPTGLQWDVDYEPTSLTLVVEGPMAGDCDMDDDVDLTDHAGFENCLAGPGTSSQFGCECLDMNYDGTVDLADFALFQAAFGNPD